MFTNSLTSPALELAEVLEAALLELDVDGQASACAVLNSRGRVLLAEVSGGVLMPFRRGER